MSTELKRYMVSLRPEIEKLILADCASLKRKVATHIMITVEEAYQARINQPMIFGRSQPIAKESRAGRPLVFRAPPQPSIERDEARHVSNGPEKS